VVIFESSAALPEGTPVTVVSCIEPAIRVAKKRRRVVLPLVKTGRPGSLRLTGERIAQILEEDDLASFRKSLRRRKS
jgi:hypothetical protein